MVLILKPNFDVSLSSEMSAANCYIVYLISVGNVRSSAENFILPGILHIFVRQCR